MDNNYENEGSSSRSEVVADERSSRMKKVIAIVVILLLLAAGLGIGGYLFGQKNGSDNDSGISQQDLDRQLAAMMDEYDRKYSDRSDDSARENSSDNDSKKSDSSNGSDSDSDRNSRVSDARHAADRTAFENWAKKWLKDNARNGQRGSDGTNGFNGRDGSDGTNGRNGSDGDAGSNGSNGKKGSTGEKGSKGNSGKNGKNGSDGDAGSNGKPGKKGEKGSTGAKGSDGKNGSNGSDGKDGVDGTDGKDGQDGEPGKDGSNGSDDEESSITDGKIQAEVELTGTGAAGSHDIEVLVDWGDSGRWHENSEGFTIEQSFEFHDGFTVDDLKDGQVEFHVYVDGNREITTFENPSPTSTTETEATYDFGVIEFNVEKDDDGSIEEPLPGSDEFCELYPDFIGCEEDEGNGTDPDEDNSEEDEKCETVRDDSRYQKLDDFCQPVRVIQSVSITVDNSHSNGASWCYDPVNIDVEKGDPYDSTWTGPKKEDACFIYAYDISGEKPMKYGRSNQFGSKMTRTDFDHTFSYNHQNAGLQMNDNLIEFSEIDNYRPRAMRVIANDLRWWGANVSIEFDLDSDDFNCSYSDQREPLTEYGYEKVLYCWTNYHYVVDAADGSISKLRGYPDAAYLRISEDEVSNSGDPTGEYNTKR